MANHSNVMFVNPLAALGVDKKAKAEREPFQAVLYENPDAKEGHIRLIRGARNYHGKPAVFAWMAGEKGAKMALLTEETVSQEQFNSLAKAILKAPRQWWDGAALYKDVKRVVKRLGTQSAPSTKRLVVRKPSSGAKKPAFANLF